MICLTAYRGEGLYNTDCIGKLDPYLVLRIVRGASNIEVTGRKHTDAGRDPDFEQEVMELEYWKDSPMSTDTLTITVMDEDLFTNDVVGTACVNLSAACLDDTGDGVEHQVPLWRSNGASAGSVFVRLEVPELLREFANSLAVQDRFPIFPVQVELHRNNAAGGLTGLLEGDGLVSFMTYEVRIPEASIEQQFGDAQQANYDDAHAAMFADDLRGKAIRAVISLEHNALYTELSETQNQFLQTGAQFIDLLEGGVRSNKRRVYTYALVDDGLRFSETSVVKVKDMISKHAVHANASLSVRCSGTFRICEDPDRDGEKTIVLDNDSGTYRPSGESVQNIAALLESTFKGLRCQPLNVLDEQPPETVTWVGPLESGDGQLVYPGKWQWARE